MLVYNVACTDTVPTTVLAMFTVYYNSTYNLHYLLFILFSFEG